MSTTQSIINISTNSSITNTTPSYPIAHNGFETTLWVPYLSIICLGIALIVLAFSFYAHMARVKRRLKSARDYIEQDISINRNRIVGMMHVTSAPSITTAFYDDNNDERIDNGNKSCFNHYPYNYSSWKNYHAGYSTEEDYFVDEVNSNSRYFTNNPLNNSDCSFINFPNNNYCQSYRQQQNKEINNCFKNCGCKNHLDNNYCYTDHGNVFVHNNDCSGNHNCETFDDDKETKAEKDTNQDKNIRGNTSSSTQQHHCCLCTFLHNYHHCNIQRKGSSRRIKKSQKQKTRNEKQDFASTPIPNPSFKTLNNAARYGVTDETHNQMPFDDQQKERVASSVNSINDDKSNQLENHVQNDNIFKISSDNDSSFDRFDLNKTRNSLTGIESPDSPPWPPRTKKQDQTSQNHLPNMDVVNRRLLFARDDSFIDNKYTTDQHGRRTHLATRTPSDSPSVYSDSILMTRQNRKPPLESQVSVNLSSANSSFSSTHIRVKDILDSNVIDKDLVNISVSRKNSKEIDLKYEKVNLHGSEIDLNSSAASKSRVQVLTEKFNKGLYKTSKRISSPLRTKENKSLSSSSSREKQGEINHTYTHDMEDGAENTRIQPLLNGSFDLLQRASSTDRPLLSYVDENSKSCTNNKKRNKKKLKLFKRSKNTYGTESKPSPKKQRDGMIKAISYSSADDQSLNGLDSSHLSLDIQGSRLQTCINTNDDKKSINNYYTATDVV